MHTFLSNNRQELIDRCKAKVAARPRREATDEQLKNGVPLFLDQLTRTLKAEEAGEDEESIDISGSPGGTVADRRSQMGVSAAAHGMELLKRGYTVDQVVHDYGDLCQAITDLAVERDAPFSINEFRTLNRCLDNAIARAVTEFSAYRDSLIDVRRAAAINLKLGFLVHELRNGLATATLAIHALEVGNLSITGATGGVLKRSLKSLGTLITHALDEVRATQGASAAEQHPLCSLAEFLAEAGSAAALQAQAQGHLLHIQPVDASLGIRVNRDVLQGALANLLHNAFKYTRPQTMVSLSAYALDDRIRIDVADHCGGLPLGDTEKMFMPFFQAGKDRTGVGLGLSIARKAVEADGGTLSARDLPGVGCVFTISLPRFAVQQGMATDS
ncbi:MAG: HAMP domain-containing histidine kinase [Planctomycetes bacterium]|nr:HAMP domain-containing histidine kinase [Planctomycetota bacterium]